MTADAFAGRRVLVTGGLGFLGSTLVRRLATAGARVTAVDALTPGLGGNRFNLAGTDELPIRVVVADITSPGVANELVRGQEFVFNLVGQSCHRAAMENPAFDLDRNCRTHLHLLEACRLHAKDAKVVFTGTRQVYGRVERLPVDEDAPTSPVDINSIHKLAAEEYHRLYARVYGLRTCCLRLTNTYGPRMYVRDGRLNFLGLWVRCLVEGRPFEVWGGEQRRDYSYSEDVADALLAAAAPATDGGFYNLGGLETVCHHDLARHCVNASGGGSFAVRSMPSEQAAIDVGDYHGNFARFQATTGWKPRVSLAEGLTRTLRYFREHLTHYVCLPAAPNGESA